MRRLATLVVVAALMLSSARAETLEWIQQFGTSSIDGSTDASVDGLGSVYITGTTEGSLGGTNAGSYDAFLSKYDASGTLEWIRQFGTSESDGGSAVSADGLGNVYIAGETYGSLDGNGTNAGRNDVFISKYDESGTLEWTRQLGTSDRDEVGAVSADGLGSVYITGTTEGSLGGTNAGNQFERQDAFLSKYDASGTVEWIRQLGTSRNDRSYSVSADGLGSVYISGRTGGDLKGTNAGEYDAFLSKYDASGTLEWIRQFGTSSGEEAEAVSADGLGHVFIAGSTGGDLEGPNAGENNDAFLSKYDASGTVEWTRQFGTSSEDHGHGVSADGLGNVYISGITEGSLGGGTNAGDWDAFLSKYDASGTLEWIRQLGTSDDDRGQGVSADGQGSVYLSGGTKGSLGGTNAGDWDVFVAKFTGLLLGDVNGDGEVNGLDVDPFVEVLLNGSYQPEADMNDDQVVNGLDVDPFVAAVVGDTHQIPEPPTLLLCIVALGLIGGWRKWGG